MQISLETTLYSVADHVATITLNRPDRLNAFTVPAMKEMLSAFDEADADDDVRAVIVTGAGRAFCAGADLSRGPASFDYASYQSPREALKVGDIYRDSGGHMTLRMFRARKPIIVAVNGPAVGVGATMPLAADYRLASTRARFAFPFVRRGIVPESAASWFLPRIVGLPTALDWCLSGRHVSAAEALGAGLVRSVHEPDALLPAAREIGLSISESAPVSVAATRQMLWRMMGAPHPMMAHRIDSRGVQACGAMADAYEGIASFLEKRPADFRGSVSCDFPDIFPDSDEPAFL